MSAAQAKGNGEAATGWTPKTGVALVFPGQGSQHIGMGQSLYEASAAARAVFEEASDTLSIDMRKLCFTGPMRELARVDNMQLSLLTVSRAAYAVYLEQFGLLPAFAAGHSLGEYSALVCSGALAFDDALRVVKLRGELALGLTERNAGYMMVVQHAGQEELLASLCEECSSGEDAVVPACFNSGVQTVVSGTPGAIEKLEAELWKRNLSTTPLLSSAPFHSPLMEDAARAIEQELARLDAGPFRFPVLSGVTARPYVSGRTIAKGLGDQLIRPVQWRSVLDYLEEQGIGTMIEMGPQSVLKALAAENGKKLRAFSFGAAEDRRLAAELLGCAEPPGRCVHEGKPYHFIELALGIAAGTRNANPDDEAYERVVAPAYERLERLADEADAAGGLPVLTQMREAMELLGALLEAKRVPMDERDDYMKELLDMTGTTSLLREVLDAESELELERAARSS